VIVALVPDLMDRSRIDAALPDVTFVRDVAACADATVVVIDLGRHGGDVGAVRAAAPTARIVAFGAHVDGDSLTLALTAGADVVLARSQFFRDPATAVGV
jgi:hypothetical protein